MEEKGREVAELPQDKQPDRKRRSIPILMLIRIVLGIGLCAAVPVLSLPEPLSLIVMACGGLVAGIDLLFAGIYGLLHEDYFNRNTLLLVICVVSFIVGVGYEGSILLILTQIGLLISEYVRKKARDHVLALTGLQFDCAHVLHGEELVDTAPSQVSVGDEVIVHAGEYFPVDCIVIDGESSVDARLIDGKSEAVQVSAGDYILAGMLNLGGNLHCEVTSDGTTTASDILEVLRREEASALPMWVKVFQPLMMLFSVAIGVAIVLDGNVDAFEAVHRALAVVTLSSAVPAYAGVADIRFAARAGVASRGIVFATDSAFEAAGQCKTAVFCAEGTLTDGHLRVTEIHSEHLDEATFLKVAAHTMGYSETEAAEAIMDAYGQEIVLELVRDFTEIPNCGVKVIFDGVRVVLGTQTLMINLPGFVPVPASIDQQIYYMVVGNRYAGYLVLSDSVKEYADSLCTTMRGLGMDNLEFVTGYCEETAAIISQKTDIQRYAFERGADARIEYLEQVTEGMPAPHMYVYHSNYASDMHSSAALDVSISGKTSDLIHSRADVVIPGGRVSAVCDGIAAAHRAVQLSNISIGSILATKALLIALAAAGFIPVWFTATLELIATLFVKVFSTSAFHENSTRFPKKK